MKVPLVNLLPLAASILLVLVTPAGVTFAASNAKPPGAKGKAAAEPAEMEIQPSVFAVPSSPKQGRNPFFPHSTALLPAPTTKPAPNKFTVDISSIVLNGIVPSGPKRTAMINGRTFEVGEEGEIKLPTGGKMLIKCDAIKDDSAIITANGQTRELRLRRGL